jgi:colicin import membrane protein
MSSVVQQTTVAEPQPSPPSKIEYGFRDVITKNPDGTTDLVRIPLTLEDVLHPQFGDFILESTLHDLLRDYLADVFRAYT